MSEHESYDFQPIENKPEIARTQAELPELSKDNIRAVHICSPSNIEHILETGGLNYKKYSIASSIIRAWSNVDEVEYGSNDPRFSSPELVCAVFDMNFKEWDSHDRNILKTPGIIPVSKLVGIIPANQKL